MSEVGGQRSEVRGPRSGGGARRSEVRGPGSCGPDFRPQTSDVRRPWSSGYTLIELAAVIGIVLIMSIAGFATIQSVRKADISSSAAKIAASVRYLYDLAVLNNRPYRLVIDLAGGSYWGELVETGAGGCGTALLPSAYDEKFALAKSGQTGAAAGTGSSRMRDGATGGLAGASGMQAEEAAPGAGASKDSGGLGKDNLLTRRTLPKGLKFSGVMTSHQEEMTEEGRDEVYFFPSGYVERAYIFLKRDDDVYTVETVPLRGTGLVRAHALDPKDLLDRT